jgi:hypothetical protein
MAKMYFKPNIPGNMKHFNERRELVESEPCELWDDIDYQPSMDEAYHQWLQPRWKKEFAIWKLRQCGAVNSPHLEQGRELFEMATPNSNEGT